MSRPRRDRVNRVNLGEPRVTLRVNLGFTLEVHPGGNLTLTSPDLVARARSHEPRVNPRANPRLGLTRDVYSYLYSRVYLLCVRAFVCVWCVFACACVRACVYVSVS